MIYFLDIGKNSPSYNSAVTKGTGDIVAVYSVQAGLLIWPISDLKIVKQNFS
jgi:hypothetical protein